jgi:hypothetical protein
MQRILGGHPEIHTVGEPWLMLHPLYALRSNGLEAEYQHQVARDALVEFLGKLPQGEDAYYESMRRMYTHLYDLALAGTGKRLFLDKTPRYYHIIPELHRVFPEARFIILFRNPLAVLCSIIDTWLPLGAALYGYSQDLLLAPSLLVQSIDAWGNHTKVVHYESLLADPERELRELSEWLGITFAPELIEYGSNELPRWRYGDGGTVYSRDGGTVYTRDRPDPRHAEWWTQKLANPQIWRLASDYLQLLGRETIERMGYSYEQLQQSLEATRPPMLRRWFTYPLAPALRRTSWLSSMLRAPSRIKRQFTRIRRLCGCDPSAWRVP